LAQAQALLEALLATLLAPAFGVAATLAGPSLIALATASTTGGTMGTADGATVTTARMWCTSMDLPDLPEATATTAPHQTTTTGHHKDTTTGHHQDTTRDTTRTTTDSKEKTSVLNRPTRVPMSDMYSSPYYSRPIRSVVASMNNLRISQDVV
jgi:hypothetical protein